jgi:RNA-directed DNA polymerase
VLRDLEQWIRRRLRAIACRQWKRGRTRFAELRRRGVGRDLAAQTADNLHGPRRLSNSPTLAIDRRIRTRMYGGVGGVES